MKKNILIAAPPMTAGGVTSSLLSLLYSIDYEKYNIDLILMRNEGEFFDKIPEKVNILPPALDERNYCLAKCRKLVSYLLKGYLFYRVIYRIGRGRSYRHGDFQLMSGLARCTVARKPDKHYDIAIGYMEGFENVFVADKVSADFKIGYVHVDYKNSGLDPLLDRKVFERLDRIVLVSAENKKSFDSVFPEFSDKSAVVENIVCRELTEKLSQEEIDDFEPCKDYFNIVTVARLSIAHKGLDRGIKALARLKNEGYKIRWYVFGDGADREILEKMIAENDVENEFILMGGRKNVYPYIKKADVMALPSRYEGKPIAVSEAQMLGIVPVVCEYASAHEQIENEVDGLVAENTDDAIYYAIKRILDEKGLLENLEKNLKESPRRFDTGLLQFYELIEGDYTDRKADIQTETLVRL